MLHEESHEKSPGGHWKPQKQKPRFHSPFLPFFSFVCHVFSLESFSGKWREILRILPLGETEVHLQDMNTGELGILVQNHAQNREVGAEAGKEAEAMNVLGTCIASSLIV